MTTTANDIISLALTASGAVTQGQTAAAADTNRALFLLNTLLSEWQLYRWIVYDLLDVSATCTGAMSYQVGPTGDFVFNGQRPDKIDAVYVDFNGVDTYCYPFMSREGYDRVIYKQATTVGNPESFFYDSSLNSVNGVLYIWPIPMAAISPNTCTIHVNAKASLGQIPNLVTPITLPMQYITAMIWNLAKQLRPFYGLPSDPTIDARAGETLMALANSIAQVPSQLKPMDTIGRGGIFSGMLPASSGNDQ
jgi:hypothetical protein